MAMITLKIRSKATDEDLVTHSPMPDTDPAGRASFEILREIGKELEKAIARVPGVSVLSPLKIDVTIW